MFIDQKGKLFGKISIIDLLVILMILVGIFGSFAAYQKVKSGKVLTENKALLNQENTLDMLEVTMRLNEVRSMTRDSVHVGDDVYAKDTNKFLGEISEITTESAKRVITGFDGKAVEAEVPERMDVILKVMVPGKRTDGGYFTGNNIHLVYDSAFEIKTPTIQTTPVIEGIQVVEKEAE